jgi:hypothetical protein
MDASAVFGWFLFAIVAIFALFGGFQLGVALRAALRIKTELEQRIASAEAAIRLEAKGLYEQAEAMFDEARAARNRVNGAKGGRPSKDTPPQPEIGSRDEYLALVERTGKTIPEFERRFFG